MKTVCFSFSKSGEAISAKLSALFQENYFQVRGSIVSPAGPVVAKYFKECDLLIFISSAGIAVRMIAPCLCDKKTDPAVLVIDDLGQFCISLLSGHLGGANEYAQKVSAFLGGRAVITTATDGRNFEAPDLFAKRNNLVIEDMDAAKRIAAMMVNGEPIGFTSHESIVLEETIDYPYVQTEGCKGGISVTPYVGGGGISMPVLFLRPKVFHVGIGCRKGKTAEEILCAIYKVFEENRLSILSVKTLSSVTLKKEEPGLLEAAARLDVALKFYTPEEIDSLSGDFTASDFVKKITGVNSVSEPCAVLSGGTLIVKKTACNGVTVAVGIDTKAKV